MAKLKIVMMVTNQVSNDPRVVREARTLQKIAEVVVLGYYRSILRSTHYKGKEKINNFLVIRAQDKDWFRSGFRLVFLLNIFRYYLQMNRFFITETVKLNPDVIHCHDLDTLLAGYLAKKKLQSQKSIKLVYDLHEIWTEQGLYLPKFAFWFFRKVEKILLRKIDVLISVNKSLIDEVAKIYHHRFNYPTLALYNLPLLIKFKKIDNFSQFRPKKIVYYHGGYMKNRGLEELILAGKHLDKSAIILLRMVASEENKRELVDLIEANNLKDRVFLIDPVRMEKTIEKSFGADIGVIPYIPVNVNNKYSAPNKLFEYPMAGMALATSDLVEFRKIFRKYQNGVTFNPKKPKSIAQTINRLFRNPSLLEKMKQNSLLQAKDCNWQKEEKKLLKLYQYLSGD